MGHRSLEVLTECPFQLVLDHRITRSPDAVNWVGEWRNENGRDVAVLIDFLQATKRRGGFTATLRHLGAFGLFALAVVDSSPLPTFGGPDILTAILAATHRNSWYECAGVATAGSVLGAYLTFRAARGAGMAYLQSKFGHRHLASTLQFFQRWGMGALAASAAIPLPSPTGLFFVAAGASDSNPRKFLVAVTLSRAARYSAIALLADYYGRHFVRVVRHPDRYWGWFLLISAIVGCLIALAAMINKHLRAAATVASKTFGTGSALPIRAENRGERG